MATVRQLVNFHTNQADFRSALEAYIANVRKTPQEAIAAKARDVGWALFRTFGKGVQSNPAKFVAEARERKWATRRPGNSLVAADARGRVSRAAMKRALALLAGAPSGYFRITLGNSGTVIISQARFGKRGKLLKSKNNRAKKGRAFAELSEGEQTAAETAGGFKRLNAQALASATEMTLRAKAGRGGTMRAQWLPREWKRRGTPSVPGTSLAVRNRAGNELGTVQVFKEKVTLSAKVPGSGSVGMRTGAFARAFALVRDDMMLYLRQRADKAARAAQERANRPPRILPPKLP